MIAAAQEALERGVEEGVFPAAQACVIADGAVAHSSAHGGDASAPTTAETLFDVASLTKVVATTTLVYRLLSAGALALSDRVGRWFAKATSGDATIEQLLAHTSGLPPWAPLFLSEPEAILDELQRVPLQAPPGQVEAYSDLGFILLGEILAQVGGAPLEALFEAEVRGPLGLERTRFGPIAAARGPHLAVAPTGHRRPRDPAAGKEGRYQPGPLCEEVGEVDDDNAWALGGAAGHAGLFSTAEDIASWGQAILEELHGAARLGDPSRLATFVLPRQGWQRGLGFDRPSGAASSAGRHLGRYGPKGAVGHLGFTGCSVWLDLDRAWVVAFLSNRVFPSRANETIRTFRPALHDAVALALEERER